MIQAEKSVFFLLLFVNVNEKLYICKVILKHITMTRKFKERLNKRNAQIRADYENLINSGHDLLESKELLSNQYDLSLVTIYRILNDTRYE